MRFISMLIVTVMLTSLCAANVYAADSTSVARQEALAGLDSAGGNSGLQTGDPAVTVGGMIGFALGILSIVLLIVTIYGGVMVMTAGGDPEDVRKGKVMIIEGVIGMAICLSAYTLSSYVVAQIANLNTGPASTTQGTNQNVNVNGANDITACITACDQQQTADLSDGCPVPADCSQGIIGAINSKHDACLGRCGSGEPAPATDTAGEHAGGGSAWVTTCNACDDQKTSSYAECETSQYDYGTLRAQCTKAVDDTWAMCINLNCR